MAVPGFSVSELIQALGQAKSVYDAFFNEYTNTASQLRDLADHIEQFRRNLQEHKDIVEEGGLEYTGYEAVQRTLQSCYRFLDEYREILDKKRRKSVVGAFKTAKFVFDQEEVNRLQDQISRHQTSIIFHSTNHVLKKTVRRTDTSSPSAISAPVAVPGHATNPTPFLLTPPMLGSSLPDHDQFSPRPSSSRSPSIPCQRPVPPPSTFESTRSTLISSPQFLPNCQTPSLLTSPSIGSPALGSVAVASQNRISIPGLVLPQSALPYRVAEVFFENKKVELKRKAVGRDVPSGREMVIVDEAGNLRYRHRIKSPRNEPCFPYTWHRRWLNEHNPLEVGFKGTAPNAHSISFKGAPSISAIPKYVFAEPKDFEEFQSELRGKHLEKTFEVRQIICASSSRNGEATDQHLKIWRDHSSQEFSISYYASNIPKPHHVEFPLAMFEQETSSKDDIEICITFIRHGEPKRARKFSKAFSRSPTESSTLSASTALPGVFTRNNTGLSSGASSVTTSNSRMSFASVQSDGSSWQTEHFTTNDMTEIHAKSMKYLRIEFSDGEEMSHFKHAYARFYQQEISTPLDLFSNWQINAVGQQRAESVVSTSPSATPFSMSPVLHPISNQQS